MTTRPVLTSKQRQLHPQGQVAAALRVARRAQSRADHLQELLQDAVRTETPEEVARMIVDRDHAQDRAVAATDEVIRIVQDHPAAGWTAEQRAYCAGQAVPR